MVYIGAGAKGAVRPRSESVSSGGASSPDEVSSGGETSGGEAASAAALPGPAETGPLAGVVWSCGGCRGVHGVADQPLAALAPFRKRCGWLTNPVDKDGDCFYSSVCRAVATRPGAALAAAHATLEAWTDAPPAKAAKADGGRGDGGLPGPRSQGGGGADGGAAGGAEPALSPGWNSCLGPPPRMGPPGSELTVLHLRGCVAAAASEEQLRFYQIVAESNPDADWLDFVRGPSLSPPLRRRYRNSSPEREPSPPEEEKAPEGRWAAPNAPAEAPASDRGEEAVAFDGPGAAGRGGAAYGSGADTWRREAAADPQGKDQRAFAPLREGQSGALAGGGCSAKRGEAGQPAAPARE
eukprot:CAMPEP_0172601810 /NCGR_PEP_ID=MMETSP1068-20121228/21987_1 /TAXON_ID=35684 /ORGANISM="Pseudopedinella elastica, Strain CCMP716" /LENGTH=352 /DNA_ID=CAMNT_0013402947 /DNA_START=59 /DNA_END=1114 /DNA_ORIENTATION=-